MMIKNKQIPVRKLLCVVIGWVHCALIFAPMYTLLLSFINNEIPRQLVVRGYLTGLIIIVPVMISWFAKNYLKNAFIYILVSIGGTVLTAWLFDSAIMLVPAVAIFFLRFYNRMLEEKETSLLDKPSYAGLALIAIPAVLAIFEERLNSTFQSLSLIYLAIYFLLCFAHHGIERIDAYIDVNKNMRNMPSRRIARIATVILAASFFIFAVVLLPALFTADVNIRFTMPETTYATPEPQFIQSDPGAMPDMGDMFPEKKDMPIIDAIWKFLEYLLMIVFGFGSIIGGVYGILKLSRRFSKSFTDSGDFVESLQEDDLEAVHVKQRKMDTPRFLDRSPNATVRRKYKKMILRGKHRPYAWMSPTEAEIYAEVSSKNLKTLHTLYEKARYSPEGCTKQDIAEL